MPCAAWAFATLALFLLWQVLTVHYNRGGNWTALFVTGQDWRVPPDLASGTYRFPGVGYDGEMYRYVAHDLLLRRGYASYIDSPGERYHRILVPALAYFLAGGQQRWIDAAYIAVIAFLVFAGAWWLSCWAVLESAHPAWALAFLMVPATLISMDRMTVDVALAAFAVGFAVYCRTGPAWKLFALLLLACLTRELGLLLLAGVCLTELLQRRFSKALLWAGAALPTIAWYLLIGRVLPQPTHFGLPMWFANEFGLGVFSEMLRPPHYPLPPTLEAIARTADVFSLAAVVLACVLALLIFLRARPKSPAAVSALLFTALVFVLTTPVFWNDVNGYGRFVSPLLILVALASPVTTTWRWVGFVPFLLIDLRLGLEFASPVAGVVRGLLHW